jgi:hypothetical protein
MRGQGRARHAQRARVRQNILYLAANVLSAEFGARSLQSLFLLRGIMETSALAARVCMITAGVNVVLRLPRAMLHASPCDASHTLRQDVSASRRGDGTHCSADAALSPPLVGMDGRIIGLDDTERECDGDTTGAALHICVKSTPMGAEMRKGAHCKLVSLSDKLSDSNLPI